jgi:glucose-1-phosphate adenylyltransferase
MAKALDNSTLFLQMDDVVAIVLGGGRGTRLWPLTAERAKPAVPLVGRYRLIDIPLSNCLHSKLDRIFVLTQFNSGSLNRHITSAYKFDNFTRGFVEILAAEQTDNEGDNWYQGTADAIRKAIRHIRNVRAKHYVILAGDHLYRMDYRTMMATHLRENADITVAALPVSKQDAGGFGVMKVSANGRIREFVEKPQSDDLLKQLVFPREAFEKAGFTPARGRDYLGSMGVYAFKANVMMDLLSSNKDWNDFGQHVIPSSLKSHKVIAHPFMGYWEDIGTVRSYFDSSLNLTGPRAPFDLNDPYHTIYTNSRYLPGARVNDGAIKDSILCEGCHIEGATLTNAIVGIRTHIQKGAEIDRSIIMGADYYEEHPRAKYPLGIGRDSKISGAIIDKNARIGKGVVIRGSKRLRDQTGDGWAIRDGVAIVLKNAVIPDGTVIG